ncbi:MAG TPA: right-handed parallel beta-helix repeat-containing protein [Pseudonocardia sp.]
MKAMRIGLTGAVLTVGLLTVGEPAAIAAPAVGAAVTQQAPTQVPAPTPVPDPTATTPAPAQGAGAGEIGSVSAVAAANGQQAAQSAATPTVTQFSSPAEKSQAIWTGRGRPDRLIIVRRGSIDTVQSGRLLRHNVRFVSAITLRTLSDYVPSSWLSIDGTTARLSAALVLSTGVTLDVGAPVATLALTGGAAAPAAATVFTGGGAVLMHGVTVVSADPVTGAPMPVGPGRPYIVVSQGGRLDAADSVIGDLGAVVGPKSFAGLTFDAGSTGSVVRTTLPRNAEGLMLDQSEGVRLESVTLAQAAGDGLVLHGDKATTLVGVTAQGNGKSGVLVNGRSTPRAITGITMSGNHDYGLVVVGQAGARISGITTTGDGAGGLEISHSTDVAVNGFSANDEPTGVYSHVSSARLTLDNVNVMGGRQGIVIEKTTMGMNLTQSRVEGTELGVSLGGHDMRMTDVSVVDSQTAVAVQRGAAGTIVDRLTINGGKDGFIANPGTTDVVLRDLSAAAVTNTAVRALSPGEQISGGRIDGSNTGIDVQAPTTLTGVTIDGADTGIRARTTSDVSASQLDVVAVSVGINIADGTPVVLSGSRVQALESVRGNVSERGVNDLSLPPLSVLGAIGVPLVLLAIVLEMVAAIRQRRRSRGRNELAGPGNPTVPPLRTHHRHAAAAR